MILIMAREINASAVRVRCSTSLASRRLRLIQDRVRSTTQRIGKTAKPVVPCARRTISSVQDPARATAVAAFDP